jgi:hypothetical protein
MSSHQAVRTEMVIVSCAPINPNGPTPAWATRLLLVETPFKTLQSMRHVVATGRVEPPVILIIAQYTDTVPELF